MYFFPNPDLYLSANCKASLLFYQKNGLLHYVVLGLIFRSVFHLVVQQPVQTKTKITFETSTTILDLTKALDQYCSYGQN
mgnify:FL=1